MIRHLVLLVSLCVFGIVGCNPPQAIPTDETTPTPIVADISSSDPMSYRQPFEAATTHLFPDGFELPPETTAAGKSAAKLASEVQNIWPNVTLPMDGEPVRVTLEAESGRIELTLEPSAAPNHVRNLLALVKVGYFDGLCFERVVSQVSVSSDGINTPFEFVTFGCPVGDGTPGRGHIGYFLKPEGNDATHTVGSVGVWREDTPASAGTRFYITLGVAPPLDGQYTIIGKVSNGLETVRAIADAPPKETGSELPLRPVKILRATTNR